MKRIFFIVAIGVLVNCAYSQSFNTQSTISLLRDYGRAKTEDRKMAILLEAKGLIDQAAVNSETAADAKTLYYKAEVYLNLFRMYPDSIAFYDDAVAALKSSFSNDTKKKYVDNVKYNIDTLRGFVYQEGLNAYNSGDYESAMMLFEQGLPLLQVLGQTDTAFLMAAAVSAEQIKRFDKAVQYYTEILESGMKKPEIYYGLIIFYTNLKDKENAEKIIEEGRKLYPTNQILIRAETNYYMAFGENEKAIKYLSDIIKVDSLTPTLYYALGTLYDKAISDTAATKEERQLAIDSAMFNYRKAVELEPNYFEAYFNMGIVYFNEGAEYLNKANSLPIEEEAKYAELQKVAEDFLNRAVPFLEKASDIMPTDLDTLNVLRQTFSLLKNGEKLKEVNAKIAALTQ